MCLSILKWLLCGLLLFVVLHTIVRIVRRIHKFPIPAFAANVIDNPLRRRFQPPDGIAVRHGIEPGMTVLDVGPGNGRYTLAAARRVGEAGKVVAVDIEPRIIDRLQQRIRTEGIQNLEARLANVYALPFDDRRFDVITLIAVIGEIPEPVKAMREFHRVLSPAGKLVFSEIFLDPDYPRASTIEKWAQEAHFKLDSRVGNWFHYTLIFRKV